MPTFKQYLKQSLTLLLFIMTLSASTVFAEADAESSLWSGVYNGFTPCDDCKGIKTTLALNKNNSYLLLSQYVGKSDREIVEKGKFTIDSTGHIIVLTPRNSEQTRQYIFGDNKLVQLDNKGNRITGGEADRYILRRNEIKGSQPQSSHH
jgi:uncharacterized lipoprotein NlpE involved in copper resistance